MDLAWKVLIPLSVTNVVAVMVVRQFHWNAYWLFPASIALTLAAGIVSVNSKRAEINRRPRAAVPTA